MTKMKHSRAFLNEICRQDLHSFINLAFNLLNSDAKLIGNWHLQALTHQLSLVESGKLKRLIVTMPPRHLKSFVTTTSFPAWVLGKDPSKRIITASYSQELASTHTRQFRRLVETPNYADLFGALQFKGGKNSATELETTNGGGRLATSVGGTLTGRGGDIIIIDDPIKTDAAMSEAERENVINWFNQTVSTRLDNPSEGAIIIVMQRLHDNDLVGHLLTKDPENWTVLNIPAIAQEGQTYKTGYGPTHTYTSRPDEVLCEERMSRQNLESLRQQVGTRAFSAQYLQQPTPTDGTIVKRNWLRLYDVLPTGDDVHAIVQSWDTAYETGKSNDYSVCSTWLVSPKGLFLKHVYREKLEFPHLLRKVEQLAIEHRANEVLVEDIGSGKSLRQTVAANLRKQKIIARTPVADKQTRLTAVSHMFENGTVALPQQAEWLDSYIKELTGFPAGQHDDQVDSTSQFLDYIASKTVGYYRFAVDGKRMQIRRPGRTGITQTKPQKYGSMTVPDD
jgi:predicted phage terminase large subunit-like protein